MSLSLRVLVFLTALLLSPAAFAAAPPNSSSADATPFDLCRGGNIRGGGFDSATGYYDWTCGNYNWSGEVGGVDANGVSEYGKPTTPGGNSWYMLCTGDGVGGPEKVGTATAAEQGVCLYAGEKVRMYSMADIQLAIENARPHGGKVYLPRGLYHDSYCGKQPDGTYNGCPVMKSDPTFQVRKWTAWAGRSVVGEGRDLDGPLNNGRTGTYLISDHNQDDETDGFSDDWPDGATDFKGIACGSFGVTCNFAGNHWAWHLGRKTPISLCAWPSGATGCDTDTSNQIANYYTLSASMIARGSESTTMLSDIIPASPDSNNLTYVCVNNNIATAGVCSGNVKVQCTNDTEVRTGDTTGGCPGDLGTCIGYADAIEQVLETNSKHFLYARISEKEKLKYAGDTTGTTQSTSLGTASTKAFYTTITSVGSTCSSTGRAVEVGSLSSTLMQPGITDMPIYDSASQLNTFIVLDPHETNNFEGVIEGVTVLAAQWTGRTGGTTESTCSTLETDNYCDEVEKVNLSGDLGGTWRNFASWYTGGGTTGNLYAFSEADGDPGNFYGELTKGYFAGGRGLLSDASGWKITDTDIVQWDAGSVGLLKLNFSPGGYTKDLRVYNSYGPTLFTTQKAGMHSIEDITLIGNEFTQGIVSTRGGSNFTARNFRGWGNVGPVAVIVTDNSRDVYNISIRDFFFENQRLAAINIPGAIAFTDFNGAFASIPITGFIDIENFSVEYNAGQNSTIDQLCGIVFDGGLGTDAASTSGAGRLVDDNRNALSLRNVDISGVNGASAVEATSHFCFGNTTGTSAAPTGAASTNPWVGVRGPLPSWQNFRMNGVMFPDNPYRSIAAADAGDCGVDVPFGTIVLVHDLDGADCSETGGLLDDDPDDGTNEVGYCGCKSTGAWGVPF